MLFIIGVSRRVRDDGPGSPRECPRCHNTTVWHRERTCLQLTLFFVIPLWRWNRRRFERCEICGETLAV